MDTDGDLVYHYEIHFTSHLGNVNGMVIELDPTPSFDIMTQFISHIEVKSFHIPISNSSPQGQP